MVHVMAIIPVQPAHLATVATALATLAAQAWTEAGCMRYQVFQRKDEPVLVTQETWADAAAESAHCAGPHVNAAFAAVGHLLSAPPALHRYLLVA